MSISRVSELWMPPAKSGCLGARYVDDAVLGVVHEDRSLGHPVRHDGPCHDDAVAVVGLDPLVVLDADLLSVLDAHPDLWATAGQRQHEEVVLVLGVDRPLRVGCQVPDRHLLADAAALVTEDAVHVERWPVDGQLFAELGHPVVVEEEVQSDRSGCATA